MKKFNKKILITISAIFLILLMFAICIDYKRGVFNSLNYKDHQAKNNYILNRTIRKKHSKADIKYKNYKTNNTKKIRNNKYLPTLNAGTSRKLEGDEKLHSRAKTAYFNYLSYSLKQNMPKELNYPIETNLWLILDINKKGYVIAYDIYNYNGPEGLKNAVITALEKTAPFQPIPDEYQGNVYKTILVFSNGGNYIGQGSIYNPPIPNTKIVQKGKTNTLKVTDVKLTYCNGSFPANLPHDMMSYIHKLHKQIKANWIPVTTEINDIRLSYTIDKDGKISNIDIGYSRGPEEAILAAKNAILAIKAPKFPDSSNLTELRLNHYFDVKENKIY